MRSNHLPIASRGIESSGFHYLWFSPQFSGTDSVKFGNYSILCICSSQAGSRGRSMRSPLHELWRSLAKFDELFKGRQPTQKTTHPNKNSLCKQFAQTLLPLFCLFYREKGDNLYKLFRNCLRKLCFYLGGWFFSVGSLLHELWRAHNAICTRTYQPFTRVVATVPHIRQSSGEGAFCMRVAFRVCPKFSGDTERVGGRGSNSFRTSLRWAKSRDPNRESLAI